MDNRTVLVAEIILGLVEIVLVAFVYAFVPAEHNDDDGVEGDGDNSADGNDDTIERLDEGERIQPGGGIDNIAGVVRHSGGQVCGSIHEAPG